MTSLIKQLHWRYATKKFDSTKKISEADLKTLKEAVQLAPSSFGLQAYKVFNISNVAIKAKLKPASWGQSQISDASHLFVFAVPKDFGATHIDEMIKLRSHIQGIDENQLKGYGDFIKGKILPLSEGQKQVWLEKQTYIALAHLLVAAADLNIDACPMEGFDNAQYDEILGLPAKGWRSSVVATLGYRDAQDVTQSAKKVRQPLDKLFEEIA